MKLRSTSQDVMGTCFKFTMSKIIFTLESPYFISKASRISSYFRVFESTNSTFILQHLQFHLYHHPQSSSSSSCLALECHEGLALLNGLSPALSTGRTLLAIKYFSFPQGSVHTFLPTILGLPLSLFPSGWLLKTIFCILSTSILFMWSVHSKLQAF